MLVIECLLCTLYCLGAYVCIVLFNQVNSHVHCEISVIVLNLQARKLRLTGIRQLIIAIKNPILTSYIT